MKTAAWTLISICASLFVEAESTVNYSIFKETFSSSAQTLFVTNVKYVASTEDNTHAVSDLGCDEGWFSHKDLCLWIEHHTFTSLGSSYHQRVSNMNNFFKMVEDNCLSKQARPAVLDTEGVTFVGHLQEKISKFPSLFAVSLRRYVTLSPKLKHLYRFMWQWGGRGGPIPYDMEQWQWHGLNKDCAVLATATALAYEPCYSTYPRNIMGFACSRPNRYAHKAWTALGLHLQRPRRSLRGIVTKVCTDGSSVQLFHRCQHEGQEETGSTWSPNSFALFSCSSGPPVHPSITCDGTRDCVDGSDEQDCRYSLSYIGRLPGFQCSSSNEIIPKRKQCDATPDCIDSSDEEDCLGCAYSKGILSLCPSLGCVHTSISEYLKACVMHDTSPIGHRRDMYLPKMKFSRTGVVTMDGQGLYRLIPADDNNTEGMLQCGGYFIPSFLINNGERDCHRGEDENIPGDNFTCPGFYRCHTSGSCVHPDFVCDGIYHCPERDDEKYCNLACPENCVCEGYAFRCSEPLNPLNYLLTRYLDYSGIIYPSLENLHVLELLKFLNLSNCELTQVSLWNMQQLSVLDLSFNHLGNLSSFGFRGLDALRTLQVSHNPLVRSLDSSFSRLVQTSGLTNLRSLMVRHTRLQSLANGALGHLESLHSLDLRDNRLSAYNSDVFQGLDRLRRLWTDDPRLCCSHFHPARSPGSLACWAPRDELSSCLDLLRSDVQRVLLWCLSALAVCGNVGVLAYRLLHERRLPATAPRLLVPALCAADLLTGLYLVAVGAADLTFRGRYVAREAAWRRSVLCTAAGLLGLLATEVSVLTIGLISLDRLLAVAFPLRPHLHMGARGALTAVAAAWVCGGSLASLPLALGLQFYGHTGICLPLPVTRQRFSGRPLAFGIFVVFNFVAFVFIGAAQVLIYVAVRRTGSAAGGGSSSKDVAVARRLSLVAVTDFACWFPIGVLGLLADGGVPVPGAVSAWLAVLVVPLNAALNPFLYTINGLLQRRRLTRQARTARRIMANVHTELLKLRPALAEDVVRQCVHSRVVKRDRILQWLQPASSDNVPAPSEGQTKDSKP